MLPKNREPTLPGEILRQEFLEPLEMTQDALAKKMKVTVQTVNRIVKGKQEVTAHTAWALALAFDTTPHFWLNLQSNVNLWRERPTAKVASAK
jgi:addiction module HigA family antidote